MVKLGQAARLEGSADSLLEESARAVKAAASRLAAVGAPMFFGSASDKEVAAALQWFHARGYELGAAAATAGDFGAAAVLFFK